MAVVSAVPFTLKRSSDLYTSGGGYESTTETAHGLVRLEEDRLVIQWRLAVVTESMEGPACQRGGCGRAGTQVVEAGRPQAHHHRFGSPCV